MLWREVLEVYETLIFSLTLAICLIQLVELQISCESGIFFSDDLYLYVFSIVMFWTCKQPNFSFLLWGIMTFDYSGSRLRTYPVYYTMSLQEAKLTEKWSKVNLLRSTVHQTLHGLCLIWCHQGGWPQTTKAAKTSYCVSVSIESFLIYLISSWGGCKGYRYTPLP